MTNIAHKSHTLAALYNITGNTYKSSAISHLNLQAFIQPGL